MIQTFYAPDGSVYVLFGERGPFYRVTDGGEFGECFTLPPGSVPLGDTATDELHRGHAA